jgi:hypothetical protein
MAAMDENPYSPPQTVSKSAECDFAPSPRRMEIEDLFLGHCVLCSHLFRHAVAVRVALIRFTVTCHGADPLGLGESLDRFASGQWLSAHVTRDVAVEMFSISLGELLRRHWSYWS